MRQLREQIQAFLDTREGNVSVVAKSLTDNRELLIRPDRVFPSASTIKLYIMSELFRQQKAGLLSLSDTITLTDEAKVGGDGILKELRGGHRFELSELCTLMIILSDNTATNLLIDRLGLDKINEQIHRLGMEHSSLQRKMMDFAAIEAGRNNYISAREFASVLEGIYRGTNVDAESSAHMLGILKRQQVTGRLDLYLPEDVVIAHKTGDLDNLEHDGGIVYGKAPYLLCVLTENVKSNREGREIICEISRMVYDYENGVRV